MAKMEPFWPQSKAITNDKTIFLVFSSILVDLACCEILVNIQYYLCQLVIGKGLRIKDTFQPKRISICLKSYLPILIAVFSFNLQNGKNFLIFA